MLKKVIFSLIVVASIFGTVISQEIIDPEYRCQIDGGLICYNCKTVGRCTLVSEDPDTYVVTVVGDCPSYDICDDEYFDDPLDWGTCIRIRASACRCSYDNDCILDPNNPDVILHCEENTVDPDLELCIIDEEPDLGNCSCRYSEGETTPSFLLD